MRLRSADDGSNPLNSTSCFMQFSAAVHVGPISPAFNGRIERRQRSSRCRRRSEELRTLSRSFRRCAPCSRLVLGRLARLALLPLRSGLDFNLAALALLLLYRDIDFEYAIIEPRRRGIGLGPLRQRNDPIETAVPAFGHMHTTLVPLPGVFAFASQNHGVVGDLQPDIVRLDARKVRAYDI